MAAGTSSFVRSALFIAWLGPLGACLVAACGSAATGFGDVNGSTGPSAPNGVDDNTSDASPSNPTASTPITLPDGGIVPDAGDVYDTPTVCTSGQTWLLGDTKSADMKPGSECQTCHVLGGAASGKDFDIAGTVYPTAHEPDDCYGAATATVVITDAKGATTNLSVGASGNFYHDDGFGFLNIATPYTATVTVGSKTRPMLTPQTDGNCNHCHTTAGTLSAPGRVMLP